MKIIDLISNDKQFISLEFFPPKERQEWSVFFETVARLTKINPKFVSVTYGAGGSTHGATLEIVSRLKQEFGLEAMAHLTCIGDDESEIASFLDALAASGVKNVLALRGDVPQNAPSDFRLEGPLRFASDLVRLIKVSRPGFGIGVAAYPEVHPEAASAAADLENLKRKLDNGGDFAITQLFFDNRLYFEFVERARAAGITQPIIPGILPVVNLKVIKRIMSLCGATIPADYMAQLEQADARGGNDEVQKLGIAHARKQAEGLLAGGAPGVHLYTLNRVDASLAITQGLLP